MSVDHVTARSLREVLSDPTQEYSIDALVAKMDQCNLFPPSFAQSAVDRAKKTYLRRTLSSMKDKEGFPLYPSIVRVDEDGQKQRVYKQETLFDVEDYKVAVNTHVSLSNHHRRMAEGYVERCKRRHQVQLSLWDLEGVSEDVENEIDDDWTSPTIRPK